MSEQEYRTIQLTHTFKKKKGILKIEDILRDAWDNIEQISIYIIEGEVWKHTMYV